MTGICSFSHATLWLHMLVADSEALGSSLARTTLRLHRERPVVADQRRLAKAILAGGRQAIDIRGLLLTPEAPTKTLVALHRFAHVGHMPHLEARHEVAALIEELVWAGQWSQD